MRTLSIFSLLATILLLTPAVNLTAEGQGERSPGVVATDKNYKGFPKGEVLISPQELKSLLDAKTPNLVVLAADNGASYTLGHIPGAFLVDRPAYEAPADTQGGVKGNLISPEGFTQLSQGLGISQDTLVVVYDNKYDASRLWWAFVYYGHTKVRVLDGGVPAWQAAGYGTEMFAPSLPAVKGSFVARVAFPSLRVGTSEIVSLKNLKNAQLWDTRELKEFTGEQLLGGASRPGRIPGAVFSHWGFFKNSGNVAEWKTYNEVKKVLTDLGYDQTKEQYFYCQSGVRSTQALLALYLSGWPLDKLHNYDDSWIGYSQATELPLVIGPAN